MRSKPRILLADHPLSRRGMRIALADEVIVCAEAGDAGDAIRAAMREQPDLGIVGSGLPGGTIPAVRGISRAAPGCAIVVVDEAGSAEDLLEFVRAGAVGYLPGPVTIDRLRRVERAVAAHEAAVPRSMALQLILELRDSGAGGGGLTGRETRVLGMLRRGGSTAEIAERLGISPVTVRRHVSGIMRKLGVERRSDLTDRAGPSATSSRLGRS